MAKVVVWQVRERLTSARQLLTDQPDEAHEEVARAGQRGGHDRAQFSLHERQKPTHDVTLRNTAWVSKAFSRSVGSIGLKVWTNNSTWRRTPERNLTAVKWHLTWSFSVPGYYRFATYWMQPGCTLGFFAVGREGKSFIITRRLCSKQKRTEMTRAALSKRLIT